MKIKEKVELSSKIADIVYKKMVILLAVVGGSGSYAIRTDGLLQVALFFVAGIFSLGLVINYFELNKGKRFLEEINDG